VTIYSDSKYVVNTMTKSWALKWRKRGWKRIDENGQHVDALNVDLWAQMLDLCDQHRVRFNWVRGHSGNPGNERCDQLAREATLSGRLGVDAVYESAPPRPGKSASPEKPKSGKRRFRNRRANGRVTPDTGG
jgi:ribonuclease HI